MDEIQYGSWCFCVDHLPIFFSEKKGLNIYMKPPNNTLLLMIWRSLYFPFYTYFCLFSVRKKIRNRGFTFFVTREEKRREGRFWPVPKEHKDRIGDMLRRIYFKRCASSVSCRVSELLYPLVCLLYLNSPGSVRAQQGKPGYSRDL